MATSAAGYGPLSSASRVRILALLSEAGDRTIQDLCAATALHANTVREHLQRLEEAGIVIATTEHRTTRGRPRTLYSMATGTADASSPVARRKVEEAAARGDLLRRVMPEARSALQGEELRQLDAVIEHLDETGFDPIVNEHELTVDLSPCVHVDADPALSDMRCGVHLTMIRSVLTEAGGPLTVTGMRPPCNPGDCIIQLARTPATP